jgi:UDP-N-acetylglucosamine 2-epimerase
MTGWRQCGHRPPTRDLLTDSWSGLLTGHWYPAICSEVNQLLTSPRVYKTMANAVNPYGDGRAAPRTAEAIKHMFGLGDRPVPFGGSITTGE